MRILGYADDAALCETEVDVMSTRLTAIADVSASEADMDINMEKTCSQHVFRRDKMSVTEQEVVKVEGHNIR